MVNIKTPINNYYIIVDSEEKMKEVINYVKPSIFLGIENIDYTLKNMLFRFGKYKNRGYLDSFGSGCYLKGSECMNYDYFLKYI